MNRLYVAVLVVSTLIMMGSVSYAAYEIKRDVAAYVVVLPGTADEAETPAPTPSGKLNYGSYTLPIGETITFAHLAITPFEVTDDSRCPMNAKCIWAGTVKAKVRVAAAMGTSVEVLELGKPFTTEAETIELTNVTPDRMAGDTISQDAYRLTFSVEKREAAAGKCYVGGCSSELCTDAPDAVSSCIYREQFACYKNATCERQASGSCGWTQTAVLQTCLAAT